MSIRVEVAHSGGPTSAALARLVREAQQDDPLAAVTVVAPTRASGLGLRRSLAGAPGCPGLADVRFEVLARVAELLGAPLLAARGSRPLRPAARAEAVRVALTERPGAFAAVAGHPSTIRALATTVQELRLVPQSALEGMRRGRARDVAVLAARVGELLADRHDDVDLLRAAAESVDTGAAPLSDLGTVVVVATDPLGAPAHQLLRSLAGATPVHVLASLTGDPVDEEVLDDLTALTGKRPAPIRPAPADPPEVLVSAPDPHTEVRAAVGLLAERFHAGVPLHRMALLWTAARPYALLVRDELAAAGLPASGLPTGTLGQSPTGRALQGLLALAGGRLEREAVVHWLNAAPVRVTGGGPDVDAARWDLVSRRAGVVRDLGQWRERLERYAYEERARAATAERDDDAGRARHHTVEADQADALRRFVGELATVLRPPTGSWGEVTRWALGLLDRYVGPPRQHWRDDDVAADRAVRRAVEELAELDDLGTRPELGAFRRAVAAELEERHGTSARLGHGLVTGGLRAALGQDLEVVAVLGLMEGLAPARPRDDAVLPDRERRRIPGIPLRSSRPTAQRRAYLAALAAGRERILCGARSDPRGGRERIASRWLLHAAAAREGRPVTSDDLLGLRTRPWLRWVSSFPHSIQSFPGGLADLDLAVLERWHAGGHDVRRHPLATGRLAGGLEALHDRRHGVFSAWTGGVGARPALALGDRPVSPTRLEAWASCPFRYLLERVLHIEEVDRPEETVRIDARQRGRLVHRVLERFFAELQVPPATGSWPEEERVRLHRIADEECGRAERQGLTGKPLLWRLERERLHRQLAAFLDTEPARRRADGTVPDAVEVAFGFDDDAPALQLDDGQRVTFRGFVDRIDRAPDGTVVVIDYKTGRDVPYRKALGEHPVGRGQLLQLPVYALAAQGLAGATAAGVRAAYWFITEDGIREVAWQGGPEDTAAFRDAVGTVASGIREGHYPQRPGSAALSSRTNCDTCAFTLACDRDRQRRWQRMRELPELAGLARLEDGALPMVGAGHAT